MCTMNKGFIAGKVILGPPNGPSPTYLDFTKKIKSCPEETEAWKKIGFSQEKDLEKIFKRGIGIINQLPFLLGLA